MTVYMRAFAPAAPADQQNPETQTVAPELAGEGPAPQPTIPSSSSPKVTAGSISPELVKAPQATQQIYYQKICADGFVDALKHIQCYSFNFGGMYAVNNTRTEANPWGHRGPRIEGSIAVTQQFGRKNRGVWGIGLFAGANWMTRSLENSDNGLASSARVIFGGVMLHLGRDAVQQGDGYKIFTPTLALGVGPAHLKGGDNGFSFSTIGGGNPIPDVSSTGAIISVQPQWAFARGAFTVITGSDTYLFPYQAPSEVPGVTSPTVMATIFGGFIGARLDINSIILQSIASAKGDKQFFLTKKVMTPETPQQKIIYIREVPIPTTGQVGDTTTSVNQDADKWLDQLKQANENIQNQVKILDSISEALRVKLDGVNFRGKPFKEYEEFAQKKIPEIEMVKLSIQESLLDALQALNNVENLNLNARQYSIFSKERNTLSDFINNQTKSSNKQLTLEDIDYLLDDLQSSRLTPLSTKIREDNIKSLHPKHNSFGFSGVHSGLDSMKSSLSISQYYLDILEQINKKFPEENSNTELVKDIKLSLKKLIDYNLEQQLPQQYESTKNEIKRIKGESKIQKDAIPAFEKDLEDAKAKIEATIKRYQALK